MATPSDEAGLTGATPPASVSNGDVEINQAVTDAENAVREAQEALDAAKKVQGDVNPTTSAPPAENGEETTTPVDGVGTDDDSTDELPEGEFTLPTVAELAEAANALRAQTMTKVAALLDQVAEAMIKEGNTGGGSVPPSNEAPEEEVGSDDKE